MFGWVTKAATALFGSSSNGKGIVTEVSDAVDRWIPSAQTKQENSIEDLKAGDASQESARGMIMISHDSWFDILVDGLNRLIRPLFGYWAFGVLVGWFPDSVLSTLDPMTRNIIWTIITFYFGARVIFKDIPAMIRAIKK